VDFQTPTDVSETFTIDLISIAQIGQHTSVEWLAAQAKSQMPRSAQRHRMANTAFLTAATKIPVQKDASLVALKAKARCLQLPPLCIIVPFSTRSAI